MSEPLLTIEDAAREFRARAGALRRRLTAGEIDGAYERPGTRGTEWVMPRSSLLAAGFVARDGVAPSALPEDGEGRAVYWARRALDAEAALHESSSPKRAGDDPGRRLVAWLVTAVLIVVALIAGMFLGSASSSDDDDGQPVASDPLGSATTLLSTLTAPGDPVGHVGSVALEALPEGRQAISVEDPSDASGVRYVLVAGDAVERSVVRELASRSRMVLHVPSDRVMVFDTTRPPAASTSEPGGPRGENPPATQPDAPEPLPGDVGAIPPAESAEPGNGASAPQAADSPPLAGPEAPMPDDARSDDVSAQSAGPGPGVVAAEVVVAPGESFWDIAERIAVGTGDDVATTWADLIEANSSRLVEPGNPDLLHVGQAIVVPSVP